MEIFNHTRVKNVTYVGLVDYFSLLILFFVISFFIHTHILFFITMQIFHGAREWVVLFEWIWSKLSIKKNFIHRFVASCYLKIISLQLDCNRRNEQTLKKKKTKIIYKLTKSWEPPAEIDTFFMTEHYCVLWTLGSTLVSLPRIDVL